MVDERAAHAGGAFSGSDCNLAPADPLDLPETPEHARGEPESLDD